MTSQPSQQRDILEILEELNSVKSLNGSSMITLAIPQGADLSLTNKLLTQEYGTAANIKCRV